jgi:transcriptional regulator with XRE-family HTH domain
MNTGKVSDWLINKYLEWQQNEKSLKTQAEFADYLGFEPSTVSMWIAGKHNPDRHSVRILAAKLGLDIYEILNLPKPPKAINEFDAAYETVPPSDRAEFDDDLDAWLSNWFKEHGLKRIK